MNLKTSATTQQETHIIHDNGCIFGNMYILSGYLFPLVLFNISVKHHFLMKMLSAIMTSGIERWAAVHSQILSYYCDVPYLDRRWDRGLRNSLRQLSMVYKHVIHNQARFEIGTSFKWHSWPHDKVGPHEPRFMNNCTFSWDDGALQILITDGANYQWIYLFIYHFCRLEVECMNMT